MRLAEFVLLDAMWQLRSALKLRSKLVASAFGLTLLSALFSSSAAAQPPRFGPAPDGLVAGDVARRADDNMRSDRTYMDARMTVESPRLTSAREIHLISWEERSSKRSFIRISEPAKDAGTAFLKLHPNLWMYVPRVERTMRVPPSMMLQSWMGSDFTNDDLVRESSEIEDYDHKLLGVDRIGGSEKESDAEPASDSEAAPAGEHMSPGERRALVVEYVPHEEAAVVWGRIVAWVDEETYAPLRQEFYDEDGEKLRELVFSEHRMVDERYVPHRWTLTPLDKEGHSTTIEVLEMRFDTEIEEGIFTKRHLQQGRKR